MWIFTRPLAFPFSSHVRRSLGPRMLLPSRPGAEAGAARGMVVVNLLAVSSHTPPGASVFASQHGCVPRRCSLARNDGPVVDAHSLTGCVCVLCAQTRF